MYHSEYICGNAFQFEDFEAQLKIIVPEYRERLRTLYQLLSELDYLKQRPALLHATGPIIVSGSAGERRGDPATRLDHVTVVIPFTDSTTGRILEFGISRLDKDWTTAISLQIRLPDGGNSLDALLDLWEFSELNQLKFTCADAVIRCDEDFAAGAARVLESASQLLNDCNNLVQGPSWPYQLASCVQISDCEEFRREVERQQNLSIVDRRGMTLLTHAVVAGRADLVRLLLQMGADPNFACPKTLRRPVYRAPGYTALHFLATAIHLDSLKAIEVADILQIHGADVNHLSDEKSTPLGLASRMIWVDLVRFLLRKSARELGEGWDQWSRIPVGAAPSVDVRIIDQLLASALGHASRLPR